ncbi:hypothetical protein QYE76_059074 [Lolium multiflorum]|uniref:Transposase (putative) gypsy type domain-containing protein n=1 Tax=Lolium multiflorum TaxID=4521 RepID=A0AAD8WT04_LOLMU|nr:hypothetical protein QYE76_059074 [Lolium multiflorum]
MLALMPPCTKLTKYTAPGTNTPAEEMEISGWERSNIANQDQSTLKKLGLMKKKDALIFPGDESSPMPRIGYRLHQLTPNSILHISILITLCECFLGTHPHWGMWKCIFYLRRNGSRNVAYNVGGVVICVRPEVDYFDVKFADSVEGCRRRCRSWDAEATAEEKSAMDALMKRIHEMQNTRGEELSGVQITAYFHRIMVQPLQARKNPLWMYASEKDVDLLSKDLCVKDLEKLVQRFSSLSKKNDVPTSCRVEPYSGSHALPEPMKHLIKLGTQFIGYRDAAEDMRENLDRVEKHSEELATKLERSEKAREKAEREAATIEDLRQRLHKAKNALSDKVSQQIAPENAIIARLETQNRRFVRKMGEDFTLHEAEEDRLLDTLSILELHGDLARTNIFDVRAAFTSLFPHLFPKQTQPQTFSELARRFLPQEDLALAYRQENLKVGVEGTIALLVDWAKAGDPKGMNKEKWKTLVKAAKPHSKKILAFLGNKPEVK